MENQKKKKRFVFSLSKQEDARLEKLARANGLSKAAMLRVLINVNKTPTPIAVQSQ